MVANTTTLSSRTLSNGDLRIAAPSIFATHPWERISPRFRMAPTIEVIDILRDRGYHPVKAQQGRSRIPGKRLFTEHVFRLRHEEYRSPFQVNGELPELVLTNSHDGTSAYRFHSGLFKIACLNGLIDASSDYGSMSVRYGGKDDFASRILDATFQIVDETPEIIAKLDE
jgi:hypothetical protein